MEYRYMGEKLYIGLSDFVSKSSRAWTRNQATITNAKAVSVGAMCHQQRGKIKGPFEK